MPLDLCLKWLSLLLFFGFVVFALLIVRSCTLDKTSQRLAAALIVFWPSSIINSVRVHNDALASLLMLAALFFVANWDRTGRKRDLYFAICASALGLLTKASAYAVVVTVLCFVSLWLFRQAMHKDKTLLRQGIMQASIALIVFAGVALLAVVLRASRETTTLCQKVLGHACDGRYVPLAVDTPGRYFYFDVPDFVLRMDATPLNPTRDYFLNRLLKSSLFGTTPLGGEFAGTSYERLSVLISLLLLAMILICFVSAPLLRQTDFSRVYLGSTIIMLLCLLAFRLRAPNEFHEDFRHIFAALVPLCLFYTLIVERLRAFSKVLYVTGVMIGVLMVLSSVAFFVRIS